MTMKLFVQKTALLIMLTALLSGAVSCSKNSATGKTSNVDYWTCTMHPSVREKGPGKCPICSMDLVPVMKESATPASSSKSAPQHDHAAMLAGKPTGGSEMQGMPGMPGMKGGAESKAPQTSEFVVPVERQQQIGVRYAKVERKPLRHTIRAVGLIVPDKTRNWQFVSRVDGYVQKLDVTAPGELVEKDAPLLSIYSPDLLTSEREFVELLHMRDQAKSKDARDTPQRLIESAKRRLQLWNVTNQQIAELEMDMGTELTIPVSAVMPTGTRSVVFIDKGEGKLEPRIVQLGTKYGDIYEVKSGLEENERVVASANFLIDAESKVQGALKAFEETPGPGTNP